MSRGRNFGRLGHRANAKLSFGWPFEIAAGRLIACRREVCLTLSITLYVIKRMKQPSTFSPRVFARQFWYAILQPLSLESLTPTRRVNFADWWRKLKQRRGFKNSTKGFNPLCFLGAWTLWKHRNACVFDGLSPKPASSRSSFKGWGPSVAVCWGEGSYYPLLRCPWVGVHGLVVWSCGL